MWILFLALRRLIAAVDIFSAMRGEMFPWMYRQFAPNVILKKRSRILSCYEFLIALSPLSLFFSLSVRSGHWACIGYGMH
jgi:hypothetical protein